MQGRQNVTFRDLFNLHAEAVRLVHEAPENLPQAQFDELSAVEHQLLVRLCRARVDTMDELAAQVGYALKQDDFCRLKDSKSGELLTAVLLQSVATTLCRLAIPLIADRHQKPVIGGAVHHA